MVGWRNPSTLASRNPSELHVTPSKAMPGGAKTTRASFKSALMIESSYPEAIAMLLPSGLNARV
jgi:hypothetical protein